VWLQQHLIMMVINMRRLPPSFLQGFPKHGIQTQLLSSAFPALQRLALHGMSLTAADLSNLAACSCLSRLEFSDCNLSTTVLSSSSPFATMRSLRQLRLGVLSSSFASGLTQLTSLSLGAYYSGPEPQRLANISELTQLQHLQYPVAWGTVTHYAGVVVKRICTTFTQLRSLALDGTLFQGDLDVLLAHATHLTHLTVANLQLGEDRSAAPCGWKELTVQGKAWDLRMLGCLPLHSLTRLRFAGCKLPSRCPVLRLGGYCEVPKRLLANLGECPAWSSSGPFVELHTGCSGTFTQDHLQVLAAVRTTANKQVAKLCLTHVQQSLGKAMLADIGLEVGNSLSHLHLGHWPLPDFWPAVWGYLPALQTVSIVSLSGSVFGANVSIENLRMGLAALISSATRPVQLVLGSQLHYKVQQNDQLQELITSQGKPLVTVCGW
jgi:hypothetical protein